MEYGQRQPTTSEPVADGTDGDSPTRMSGRYTDIGFNFAIVTIPMTAFTAVLLGLVSHNRVRSNDALFQPLESAVTQNEPGFIYVDLNATFLIFIASWSSSLAPVLVGFVLALASYPIARRLLYRARSDNPEPLPTPFQLAILTQILDGGVVTALWNWITYWVTWRRKRVAQSEALTSSASLALLSVFLGLLVLAADTWLHVSTETVQFTQLTPVRGSANYSFGLMPGCLTSNNSFTASSDSPCSLNPSASNVFLIDPSVSLRALHNISSSRTVLSRYDNRPTAYLGVPASIELSRRDFTARTFGVRTQCRPISDACNLEAAFGISTPFRCSPAFSGDVTQSGWIVEYFTDDTMSSNNTIWGVNNPFYFGIAALMNPSGGGTLPDDIPDIITPVHGGSAFVLGCSSAVYDIEYDSVNGSVTRFVTTLSNTSVSNIWQSGMAFTGVGYSTLQQAASVAVLSDTAQELADKIAIAYSQVSLAVGSNAVTPQPAPAVQERSSFLVARVPAAPLFRLVIANLLFAALGICLASIGLATSGGDVTDIQARLTVAGLVADRFEGLRARRGVTEMEKLFEENDGDGSMRVAIDRARRGGYEYKVWPINRSDGPQAAKP